MTARSVWAVASLSVLLAVGGQAQDRPAPGPCGVDVSLCGSQDDDSAFAALDVSIADVMDWTKTSARGTWTTTVADRATPALAGQLLRGDGPRRRPASAILWDGVTGDAVLPSLRSE